jgi:hypothetical protein
MWLCGNFECSCVWGFWSFVTWVGFNGYFFSYDYKAVSYPRALIRWLSKEG